MILYNIRVVSYQLSLINLKTEKKNQNIFLCKLMLYAHIENLNLIFISFHIFADR